MKASEDLIIAQDENTPEEKLRALWRKSRSITVRKAIAKNPNAGPDVLRAAARLYLEEVLGNPGFAMLELFNDNDPWIKKISLAYSSPEEYVEQGHYYFSREKSLDNCLWACLLSPQLTSFALNRAVLRISALAFRRAIKNSKVKEKIKYLYTQSLKSETEVWPFDFETILFLYKEGVINEDYLSEGLGWYGSGSVSCSKAVFIKTTDHLLDLYRNTHDKNITKLIIKILAVCRSHVLTWVISRIEGKKTLMEWSGEFFVEVMMRVKLSHKLKMLKIAHWNAIGRVVSYYLQIRFLSQENCVSSAEYGEWHTPLGYDHAPKLLTSLVEYATSNGIEGTDLMDTGLTLRGKRSIEALSKCDIKVKEFFVRAKSIGDWVSVGTNDYKYQVINDVNEAIFEKEGITNNLLFRSCSTRKIITINESTHIF